MKNRLYNILPCLLMLMFAACEKEPVNSDHGISAELSWADDADKGRIINDANVWIYNAEGNLVSRKHYNTKYEVALDIIPVDAGDYTVVTAVNFVVPFTIDEGSTLAGLIQKLNQPDASPEHAHYSLTEVKAVAGSNVRAKLPLRRVMAELSIEVDGVPKGTVLEVSILNIADGIVPSIKDVDDVWGKATNNKLSVLLKPFTSKNGTIETGVVRLMPTVGNAQNTYLRFVFHKEDGSLCVCEAEAPLMMSAGKYILKMNFTELKPFMNVEPVRISDWEEDWTISGEIFNPETTI